MKSFHRHPTSSPLTNLWRKRRRPAPSASPRRGGTARLALAASIALVGAILLAPAQSHAAIVWNGGVGNWSTAGNWTGGVPNASNADVQVDNGNAVNSTVSVDGFFTVGRLTISSGDTVGINNAQQLTISDAGGFGSIINNGTLSINAGGSFTFLNISGNVSLSGSGTTVLGGAFAVITGSGRLTNSSTINGQGNIGNNAVAVTNLAAGLIDANVNGALLTIDPPNIASAFLNQGTLRASSGGILQLTGNGGGAFDNTGGTISALAGSEVRLVSSVSITGGTFTTTGSGVIAVFANDIASLGAFANSGSIVVRNNGTLNVSGTITNTGNILIESSNAGTNLTLAGNVTLTGVGTTTL